jgi:hypothetical protein
MQYKCVPSTAASESQMKFQKILLLLILVAVSCSMPVMGATQFYGGSPRITAYISGVNEFWAGQDATITVILQNNGVNIVKNTGIGTITPDDNPTTAKQLTVGLSSGTAPIVIKTDPQNVGDLASTSLGTVTSSANIPSNAGLGEYQLSPGLVTVSFSAKITSDATLGEYQLPLSVQYKYLSSVYQPGSDTIQYMYTNVTDTIPLTVVIKPVVKIDVLGAVPENLTVGTEGYINLTIRNAGYEDGKQATVTVLRNGQSAITPTDNYVYVGDFPQNGTISCQYKVAVSNDAQQQTYPIDVEVTYTDREGDTVTSATETVGIPVGGKIAFVVTSPPATISPGETKVIEVEYENIGAATAYNAQARLTAVTPFTSSDTNAFLGDMQPGQRVTASYTITADPQAPAQTYSLDNEVRYRDSLDNSQVSDTFEAQVQVVPGPSAAGLVQVLAIAAIAVVVLAGGAHFLLRMRKKV